jgi:FKBP-type peptidyl-prolyl cis-trans isomerase SlyD
MQSMNGQHTITRDRVITIQYTLVGTDGTVIRDAGRPPVSYLHGAGTLFPKLESALENHRVGDIVNVRLLPADAFGKRDTDLLCTVPLSSFPDGETIEVGGTVVGTDEEGRQVEFRITGMGEGMVQLDANHPLAGVTLVFEIEVQGIREASEEELRLCRAL